VRRREDNRFISGRGQYTDDIRYENSLRAVFVRAPLASARILSIDISAALELPGVVAVLTADDLTADGIRDFSVPSRIPNIDGSFATETPRALLARDRVLFLAEPVAMVIAQREAIAHDAAELVAVEYEDLPT